MMMIILFFVNFAGGELISPVSNSGKVVSFKHEELETAWWNKS
jgi:hypothetical protein